MSLELVLATCEEVLSEDEAHVTESKAKWRAGYLSLMGWAYPRALLRWELGNLYVPESGQIEFLSLANMCAALCFKS